MSLVGRRVLLGVTGSIAAYKAAALARLLVKERAEVQPLMTRSAERFLGAATLGGITGNAPFMDTFDATLGGELHVDLAHDADLIIVAPATADALARFAAGRANDLVTATVLCAACPVLLAPAMHPTMWSHPATRRNVATLIGDGHVALVGPERGEVASGDEGVGRMAEPETICATAVSLLGTRDLEGRHIVVTAGPTVEDIDPVRFISNRSSGKMGFAIAARAAARGARVTLIAGPVALPTPSGRGGVDRIDVRSALDMQAALGKALADADALVMAAAVGDFRPRSVTVEKLKREGEGLALDLVQNPDLLATIGRERRGKRPVLVGFAVETEGDLESIARRKLAAKKVDLVVVNHAADSFGRDDNRALIVDASGAEDLGTQTKSALADRILGRIAERLT